MTNLKKVVESILSCYPEWTINSITFLGEGDFYRAYLVNKEWVFRFAKHEEARQSLKIEHCLLPKIADRITLRIPLPQIVSFEAEKPFTAYKLLPGDSLSQAGYLSLCAENRTRCAKQVAGFLNQIHSVDTNLARDCGVRLCDYVSQYSALLAEAREHLFEILGETERLFIEQAITGYLESGNADSFRPALLHGDLSPEHIIFDEKTRSVSGIIDFGDMMIGDAAWDLLWLYEDYGLDFLSRLLPELDCRSQTDLPERVFQFSMLQVIEWTVNCQIKNDDELTEALEELRAFSREKEKRSDELISAA